MAKPSACQVPELMLALAAGYVGSFAALGFQIGGG